MDEFASRKYPIQEHIAFQRRTWVVERIGWVALVVIVLAALLGLFGGGPLSRQTAGSDEMKVQYDRFQRVTKLASFTFLFAPAANAERRLHLNREFQDAFEITGIFPTPLQSAFDDGGLGMTFSTEANKESQIVIWAHPRRYGSINIDARADDGGWLYL